MRQATRRRGRPPHPDVLTPAEWRVVNAVRHGMTNGEIGRRLGVSLDAVKFHIANAVAKLSVRNRAGLKRWSGAPVGSALRKRGTIVKAEVETPVALGSIGQISRHVTDVTKAVEWYRDVLGLRHLYTFGDLAFFDCGGTRLFITNRKEEGSAGDSILYFNTPDINAEHQRLVAHGVVFRGAPHMIHRHPDSGIEEWMAFFEDLDGQLLALMSRVLPVG